MLQRSKVPPALLLIIVLWVLITMSGQQTRNLSQARRNWMHLVAKALTPVPTAVLLQVACRRRMNQASLSENPTLILDVLAAEVHRTKSQVKSLSSMDKSEMGIELINAGYAFPAENLKTKSQMKEVLRLHREQTSQSSRGSYHLKGLSRKNKEELLRLCEERQIDTALPHGKKLNRDQMILRLRGWAPPVTLAPKAVAKPRAVAKPTVAPSSGASSSWTTPSTATAAPTAAAGPRTPTPVAATETFDMTPRRTGRTSRPGSRAADSDNSDMEWTPLHASPNTIATLTAQQTGLRAREEALQQQQAIFQAQTARAEEQYSQAQALMAAQQQLLAAQMAVQQQQQQAAAMAAHQQQLTAATTPAMPLEPADGWEPPLNAVAGGWVSPEL